MSFMRHVAFVCWEALMIGVPYRWPEIPKIAANIMIGLAVVGLVVWVSSEIWIRRRKHRKTSAANDTEAIVMAKKSNEGSAVHVSGSDNVVSVGQTGGVTARIHIDQAPEPKIREVSQQSQANSDGTYTLSALVEIVAPYTPGKLSIVASSPGILDLRVSPQGGGMMMSGHSGKRDGLCFTTIMNPSGRYGIKVKTQGPEQVSIKCDFEAFPAAAAVPRPATRATPAGLSPGNK